MILSIPFFTPVSYTHLDNLHHPVDLIKNAQENAARLYKVQESFYCINGSTGGILAAVSAAVKKGGHILMARNCHKAVYHGAYLRELKTSYLYPHKDLKLGINGGIFPEDVEKELKEHPDIEAVFITSPTYDGVVSDVEKIAKITHKYKIPLIVDEAHGAHFCFSEYFPRSAAELEMCIRDSSKASVYTGAYRICTKAWKRSGISSVYSGKRSRSFRYAKGLQICT